MRYGRDCEQRAEVLEDRWKRKFRSHVASGKSGRTLMHEREKWKSDFAKRTAVKNVRRAGVTRRQEATNAKAAGASNPPPRACVRPLEKGQIFDSVPVEVRCANRELNSSDKV